MIKKIIAKRFTLIVEYKNKDSLKTTAQYETDIEAISRFCKHKAIMEASGKKIKKATVTEQRDNLPDIIVYQYPFPKIRYQQLDLFEASIADKG